MKLRATALILALTLSLALSLLAVPLPAEAQKVGKVYRIGYLAPLSLAAQRPSFRAFLQGLRERGWVEGDNLIIKSRFAGGRYERLPELAAELVGLKPDAMVTFGTHSTRAVMPVSGTIPIVFVAVGDPVRAGFVASLSRPGGNVTGLSFVAGYEIFGKQLQLLKETIPTIARVAILGNPDNPNTAPSLRETEIAARALGVSLQVLEVRGPDEFESAYATMTGERADALLVLVDPMFLTHRGRLAQLAAKHRLPAMHGVSAHAEAGDLMAYAPSIPDLFRRGAAFVDKILKGAKPADLPVEQPIKFGLVINLKTAKALGLTIPPSVLMRADRVIE